MFVITGGGSGLGQALALALAQRECQVLIVGRHVQTLQETARQNPNITYCCADVSQESERQHLADYLAAQSDLQGLIHNAGIIEPIMPLRAITLEDWRACMSTNLEAPLFLTQLLWSKLSQARVLHIGSGAAYLAITGWAAYCVSKAGLAMLTRCWQAEYPTLAVASVMPGIIDTPMQTSIRASNHMALDKHEFFCRLKTAHQLLSPATVACFLVWLLLDASSELYGSQEWDIYDMQHHMHWLKPPHVVPQIS